MPQLKMAWAEPTAGSMGGTATLVLHEIRPDNNHGRAAKVPEGRGDGGTPEHVAERPSANHIYDVLRLPNVRQIELGWGASVIGELAGQVTLVVYAFDAGGAVLVATYAASRTLLSMAVTLAITGVSGRVQPGSLLRPLTWLRALRTCHLRQRHQTRPVTYASDTNRRGRWRR